MESGSLKKIFNYFFSILTAWIQGILTVVSDKTIFRLQIYPFSGKVFIKSGVDETYFSPMQNKNIFPAKSEYVLGGDQ